MKGYCIVMSGSDYPIKNAEYIHHYFENHYPTNFIHYLPLEQCTGYLKKWVESHIYCHWLTINNKFKLVIKPFCYIRPSGIFSSDFNLKSLLKAMLQTGKIIKLFFSKRNYPKEISCFTSETWFEITTDTVSSLVSYIDSHPSIYEYHKTVGLPEEKFFQSIILSDKKTKKSKIEDFLIYLNRNLPGREDRLELRDEDWDVLKEAVENPQYLFARKLSMQSMGLLVNIDAMLKIKK